MLPANALWDAVSSIIFAINQICVAVSWVLLDVFCILYFCCFIIVAVLVRSSPLPFFPLSLCFRRTFRLWLVFFFFGLTGCPRRALFFLKLSRKVIRSSTALCIAYAWCSITGVSCKSESKRNVLLCDLYSVSAVGRRIPKSGAPWSGNQLPSATRSNVCKSGNPNEKNRPEFTARQIRATNSPVDLFATASDFLFPSVSDVLHKWFSLCRSKEK